MVQMLKLFGFSQAELLGIRKPNMFGGIAMNGTAAEMHYIIPAAGNLFCRPSTFAWTQGSSLSRETDNKRPTTTTSNYSLGFMHRQ